MLAIAQQLAGLFFGERHQPADAVPRRLLQQLTSIPRLTGILPYLGWMADERLFVLDQGEYGQPGKGLGFCIETTPQTGANEEMERVLAGLFLTCPPGTGIQVSLYASPHILPTLRKQAELLPEDDTHVDDESVEGRRNHNIYRVVGRRRIDHYLRGTGQSLFPHHVYLLRDYRCIISITMPMDPDVPADVETAMRIRESAHATLRSAHLPGHDWGPDDLLNFCADFFDHERVFGRAADQPIEYDDSKLLRRQVSSTEVAASLADQGIRFRKAGAATETAIQCFTVRKYPRYFRLGGMGSLIGDYYQMALSIPCPFLITMGAVVQDYESAKTRASMKAARATQMAGSYMAAFQPDLADKERDWKMVLRAFDNGRSVVQMQHQIVLLSRLGDVSGAERALQSVWQARGFDVAKSVYLQHQSLLAALPCSLTRGLQSDLKAFGILGTKTADNAVMTSPMIAEWKGTQTPVLTLYGRRGQIMGLDLFDNRGGNFNFAVAALSGSGKSVYVNELTFRYRGCGAKVWIIDVGRSYQNLCALLGGEFVEFSDVQNNTICLNPFSMVLDIQTDMEMLHPLLAQMASPREPLDNYAYSALGAAIMRVWQEKGRGATITDVYDLLRSGRLNEGESERDLARLAITLEPYTKHGVYASYFEGEANIQFHNGLVVLELEELKAKKDLQAVVMQLMMYRITQEMYLDRSQRKLVIIDEAWDLMGTGASAAFIESAYRRARKYNGAIGTVTQSVEDYYASPAAKAAIQNADWMFLLRQKPESIDRLGKEGKLHIDEWMRRQLSSVATEHGHYSEIFVHGPMGSGVGRLILDPFSMLLYSTRAEDYLAIKQRTDQGLSVVEAIQQVLQERGVH